MSKTLSLTRISENLPDRAAVRVKSTDAAFDKEICQTRGASDQHPMLVTILGLLAQWFDMGTTIELYSTNLDGGDRQVLINATKIQEGKMDPGNMGECQLMLRNDRAFGCKFVPNASNAKVDDMIVDAATTSGSPTLTSLSAGFTNADIGLTVTGPGIPAGSTILSVNTGAHTATLSHNATATATGVSITILGRNDPAGLGDVQFLIRAEAL